jgi:hypothetical protein
MAQNKTDITLGDLGSGFQIGINNGSIYRRQDSVSHQYRHIQIKDDARAHFGDTYNIGQSLIDAKGIVTED